MTETVPLSPQEKDMVIPHKVNKTYQFTFYALWIIELSLAFRLLLKLLGANPENVFTMFVYGATYLLVLPFRTIFPSVVSQGPEAVHRAFETSTLFAMIVYAVFVWCIARFIIIKESKPR